MTPVLRYPRTRAPRNLRPREEIFFYFFENSVSSRTASITLIQRSETKTIHPLTQFYGKNVSSIPPPSPQQ